MELYLSNRTVLAYKLELLIKKIYSIESITKLEHVATIDINTKSDFISQSE